MSLQSTVGHTVHIIDHRVPAHVVGTRDRRRSAYVEQRHPVTADYVRAALDAREDQGLPRFVEDQSALELIAKILGSPLGPVGGIPSTPAA